MRAFFADAAGTAARSLAKPDGPRVGAVGFVGWDTRINEGAACPIKDAPGDTGWRC
jgi:uncharacterized protein (DUF1501 family)